jgi:hypothetical protein
MREWRKEWFGSDQTPPMDAMPLLPGMEMEGDAMGGMEMGGTMDMTTDVEMLRTAQPFDKAEIKDLAGAIIGAQERRSRRCAGGSPLVLARIRLDHGTDVMDCSLERLCQPSKLPRRAGGKPPANSGPSSRSSASRVRCLSPTYRTRSLPPE